MTVFKAFFRVGRRNLWPVLLYMGVMGLMAVMMISSVGQESTGLSVNTKDFSLAVINGDEGDPVSRDLIDFIGERARIRDIGSGEKAVRDALFWRDVDYVIELPKGFGQAALSDNPMKIQSISSPNGYTSVYVDMQVNRFLSTLRLYRAELPQESYEQSLARVKGDLQNETQILPATQAQVRHGLTLFAAYLRYMSYVLMAAISSGMGMMLVSLLSRNTLGRRRAGSLTETRFSFQLLFAGLTYSSLIWLFLSCLGILVTGLGISGLRDARTPYLLLSSYAYMLFSMAFTLFVAAFTQRREVIIGASNVMALGSSFLGGIFIPRQLLGEGVLSVGRLFPAYWYADAVSALSEAPVADPGAFTQYWRSMGMLSLMLLAVVCITLLVNSYRRQKAI